MTAAFAVLLLIGNAFFVAAEFALVASKRHRLEQAARTGGRSAAAALAGSRSLPLMLAGAQLGITLCSLGLGALAEPALAHWLTPLLHGVGLPSIASHAIAFVIALSVVTFLHLVIGEMMPKSWAITDPERSAILLAVPFRAFARLVGPLLRVLNALANLVLGAFGVRPQDQIPVSHGPAEMQILLDRSRAEGLIEAEQSDLLSSVLGLGSMTVREVALPAGSLVTVPSSASAADVELASMGSGRSRLAVTAPDGSVAGFVHVREAVRATTAGLDVTAADLIDQPFILDAEDRVVDAVAAMQAGRAQLAVVRSGGVVAGFVALEDLLEQVLGPFDDETDPVPAR
ncbi:CBS domain containing-hemolysin-like protein [Actinoplanes tereljensis]|uniref:Membrane protein n=1 Tax=Paractinoplanes tereljensis TaxID=571912 RepID=A0A919TRW0_9ACTN|nr:hemolysin family protein [Actinoplanes tereljensis]GIF18457.1 membrane protein [Actinoplanes tereljensis]